MSDKAAGNRQQAPSRIGRFAPSPTGPLHYGSLLAALASYLDARSQAGRWLVRMEDLDPPREVAGAADDILRTLDNFGLLWDGEVMFQSQRQDAYHAVLDDIRRQGLAYECTCTRREIRARGESVYLGHCRHGCDASRTQRAIRLQATPREIRFTDRVQGQQQGNPASDSGDFIIRRADGLFAYQLAVVVDDSAQGITDIVRGADLLSSTTAQIYLQSILGYPRPRYAHIRLAVTGSGEKLSKQTGAKAVSAAEPAPMLVRLLHDLGQQPPKGLGNETVDAILQWAIGHWRIEQVPYSPLTCIEAGVLPGSRIRPMAASIDE